jgi:hypothetical protein
MAGLIFELRAEPKRTPWLQWSWRAENAVSRGDIRTKAGDDYTARLYVLFDYDASRLPLGERARIALARLVYGQDLPLAALCYVFDSRQPVGFSAWSPYTNRMRVIVAAGGKGDTTRWLTLRRNVADDFRAAFGEEPPAIKAIAIASDTDNTGETVRAYFGDITLRGEAHE